MTSPITQGSINHLLREVKYSEKENEKVYQDQSKTYFDQKISQLRGQSIDLKKQAELMKKSAITSFIFQVTSVALNIASQFLKSTGKILTGAGSQLLKVSDSLIKSLNQSKIKKLDIEKSQKQVQAEIYGQLAEEYKQYAYQAQKRSDENQDILVQAKQDLSESQEKQINI